MTTSTKQQSLESLMVSQGIDRYHNKEARSIATGQLTKVEKDMMEASLSLVSMSISRMLSAHQDTKAKGRTPGWVLPVSLVNPDTLAFIALNNCFGAVAHTYDVRKVCRGIGQDIEMEVWALGLQVKDKDLYERLCAMAIKNHDSVQYRKQAVTATAAKEGFPFVPWDTDYCVTLGSSVLNCALAAAGLFEMYDKVNGFKDTQKLLGMTQEAQEAMGNISQHYEALRPRFLPMLTPPKPWVSMYTGCYDDERLSNRVPLVRIYEKKGKTLVNQAIANGEMTQAMDATNRIQAVPLRNNATVLQAIQHCWGQRIDIPGLPAMSKITVPPKVHPVRWSIMPMAEKKMIRKERQDIIMKNREVDAGWLTLAQDLTTAEMFVGESEFYLPHSMDFRGREYPVPSFNHQRSDPVRSLFEFANGKPLGATGPYWLAVHLANCGDFGKVSKKPFNDRYQWVLDNTEMIEGIGSDPIGTIEEWACADKPFGYLAACVEWAGFKREGSSFVSRLPIALDGSNSGVQHYSAALRSTEGALVNLTPSDRPQDVYQAVADMCLKSVTLDNTTKPELKLVTDQWLAHGISRSVVKRSVMTFAYSSGQFGFKEHLQEDLMEPLKYQVLQQVLPVHPFGADEGHYAATYMASLIWAAVNTLLPKAAQGMKFLQKCAGALSNEGKPVAWTTPLGLPVLNYYQEYDIKRLEVFLYTPTITQHTATHLDKLNAEGGVLKRMKMNMRTKPTGKIIKAKMQSTVAPNFIHSLDAAHLQATVNLAATKYGITDVLLIHDSFSTHACDTKVFQGCIKEAFVEMYRNNDVFQQFHSKVLEDISEKGQSKIDPPPSMGSLDIQEVLLSDYCFS